MKYLTKSMEDIAKALFFPFLFCIGLLFTSQDILGQIKPVDKKRFFIEKDGVSGKHKVILETQIAYGQTLGDFKVPDAATWIINGPSGTVSGQGNALNDHVFDTAGNYEISIIEDQIEKEDHDHHHSAVPSSIRLKVYAVRMTFHSDELKFSADIRKGVETKGIIMSIPVTVESLGDQKLVYDYTTVSTAGIGTKIVATLKAPTILKVGKETLEYELNGVAEEEAYVMFDFIDINGKVQVVALKSPIR